jgi:HEAT repeat protein
MTQRRTSPAARLLGLALAFTAAAPVAFAQDGGPSQLLTTFETETRYELARDELVVNDALSLGALESLAEHPDWRVRHQAEVTLAYRADPELAGRIATLPPVTTRAGTPALSSPLLGEAMALPLMVDRLVHGGESAAMRVSLARAVSADEALSGDTLIGLYAQETDAEVRAAFLVGARRHPDAAASLSLLTQGLADPSALVRAEAAAAVGSHPQGATLGDALIVALRGDKDASVRGAAARSLGWLRLSAASPALTTALSDPSADVRLTALRALERVDAPAARAAAPRLLADPDPKVAQAAKSLSQ